MSQKLIRVASNIESAKRSKLSTTLILKTHSTALYICTNCTNLNALRSVQMVRSTSSHYRTPRAIYGTQDNQLATTSSPAQLVAFVNRLE